MPRALLLIAAVFCLALVLDAVRRRRVPRTVRNWQGAGRNRDLTPSETALLAREHPATVLLLLLLELSRRGRVRWSAAEPEAAALAGPPADPVEAALAAALAEEGRLGLDGGLRVLDALHAGLEGKMAGSSGPLTVRCAQAVTEEARRSLDPARPPPEGLEALLLPLDAGEVWDSFGEGPEWEGLRAAFRARERLRRVVFPERALAERAAAARDGFLPFRRDLTIPLIDTVGAGGRFWRTR